MGFTAMAFLWTGSQIPLYLFGGIPPIIYADIGGTDRWIWFVRRLLYVNLLIQKVNVLFSQVLGNLLALAGVCPFVGSLSDLIGRRYVAVIGAALICIGSIVSSTAHTMNTFIGMRKNLQPDRSRKKLLTLGLGGMTIAGGGAGISELTALAATSEMAPARLRGKYVSILVFTIVPFCPSVLWAQLIAAHGSWRFVGAFVCAYNGIGLLVTVFFYFPPPRVNSTGLSRREVIKRVDFMGGFLSIVGMILFLAGMQWGGYQVCNVLPYRTVINGTSADDQRHSTHGHLHMSSYP